MHTIKDFLPVTAIKAPADEDAVCRVLREAAVAGTAVYPVGGGTSLAYGLRPHAAGHGASTAKLANILCFAADDLTVTVQAGMSVAELNDRLAKGRQWLPIDVPSPERATIGGVVAANVFGPRRYAYGTIRDYVLGVRAVDGRGEVFAGGGDVVENAAGYNIPRLLVGSLGTLGVITQVTLMVQPLPQGSGLVLCDLGDLETAECLLTNLTRSRTLPVAVELLAGRPRAGCPLPPARPGVVARLLVGFDGIPAEVEWMVGQLLDEWQGGSGPQARAWDRAARGDMEMADRLFQGDLLIHVLPSGVVALVEELTRLLPAAAIQAHAGSGVIRVVWGQSPRVDGEARGGGEAFVADLREKARPAVTAAGGSLVVLAAPDRAELNSGDVWGVPAGGAAVMHAIRERFDPGGILNPGRFIFGGN